VTTQPAPENALGDAFGRATPTCAERDPRATLPPETTASPTSAFALTRDGRRSKVPCLRAEGLIKRYGQSVVLDGVTLNVAKGEVLAVIGPSGSGKSTLLRCLNYLEIPEAGRVYLNGELVGQDQGLGGGMRPWKPAQFAPLRRQVGMVFQQFNLFPHLRVDENIMLGQTKALGRSRKEAYDRAAHLLASVGLEHKIHARPVELSGGEQQRVAIARALALDPQAMLFDEPTSALDPEIRREVLNVMQRLAEQGMTMIVVSHELGFAERVSNRVLFMAEGRVQEEGPPAQVLRAPVDPRTRQFIRALET
jgi:polar amino acid transport system ATP-binding protein